MHYRCIWIDKDFRRFGTDSKKWAKKVDKFLDKETETFWSIQGQSATFGGRYTGSLECASGKGYSLKDVITDKQLKENPNIKFILDSIGAYDVDENHCDLCSIQDLKTKLSVDDVGGFFYAVRILPPNDDENGEVFTSDRWEQLFDDINNKKINGLVFVVDFHE